MKAAPYDKAGIYFIEHNNAQEMEALTEEIKYHITVDTLEILKKEKDATS